MPDPLVSKRHARQAAADSAERRQSPRIAFSASGEALEPSSKAVIALRVGDLGAGGCYADSLSVFPVGTVVRLSIHRGGRDLETAAEVISAQSGMGMGMKFLDLSAEKESLLREWLGSGLREPELQRVPEPAAQGNSAAFSREAIAQPAAPAAAPVNEKFTLARLIQLMMDKGQLTQAEGRELLKDLLGRG